MKFETLIKKVLRFLVDGIFGTTGFAAFFVGETLDKYHITMYSLFQS
jgi:hypothetical protein